jgi:hypothetical protein
MDWTAARELRQFQQDTARRGHEADLAKVTHAHVASYPNDAGPGPHFYHLLAPHPDAAWRGSGNPDSARLRVNIPETAVFAEYAPPATYYTSATGCVVRRDDLRARELTSFMVGGSGAFDPGELVVAVQKTSGGRRNSCGLLSRAELDKAVDSAGANVAIQRLVRGAGARAAVSRVTVTEGRMRKPPCVFVLTRVEDKATVEDANLLSIGGEGGGSLNAKLHWLTTSEDYGTTSIAQARGATMAWAEPTGMCERIVDHVNRRGTRLSFVLTELTADFVKDAAGTWWMLQVKAFQSRLRTVPVVRELCGGGAGGSGVERRGVQSARNGSVRVASATSGGGVGGGTSRGWRERRGGDGNGGDNSGGGGRVSSASRPTRGSSSTSGPPRGNSSTDLNRSDEAIQNAFILRLGKVPGCHGDYCNTLSVRELTDLRTDHQNAVMEAKRMNNKDFDAIPAEEKRIIMEPPELATVDSSRPAATNKVAWRTVVLDREDQRAVKAQWLVRVRGQWMSYGEEDTWRIEQGVQRGAVTVKLDSQFEIHFGVGAGDSTAPLSDQPPEHPAMQVRVRVPSILVS